MFTVHHCLRQTVGEETIVDGAKSSNGNNENYSSVVSLITKEFQVL